MPSAAQDLSIRQLQYVVAVAETLGFHRAAQRCRVSQPTLSSQIQKLEDVLGVRIFERDKRRVLVTTAGEAVIQHARRVLVEVDDLLTAATEAKDPFSGTLRIGVIPTIAPYLLPFVTPAVAAQWPRLRLALVEEKTDELLVGLRAGALDAGLLALVDGMEDLEHAVVLDDPFVAAVPRTHALAKKKSVALDDLEEEKVLLLEDGHCLRAQALALCRRAGASEADLRATSLATLVQMVSSGAGVTLLPSIAVDVENRRGQLAVRPLSGRAQGRTICLAWRKAAPLGEALRQLAKAMSTASRPATRFDRANGGRIPAA
ncbi:MAG TPA: LysR substrate-binding domain-containing protein [Labilithrix sp.]|nr:LysR substrate-binding domain-containing protein [Labilithrix sp.]